MNNVSLLGRLTKDVEVKTTPSGVSVCTFNIAVDRAYKAKGEERQADFITCVAWRYSAEFIAKWFRKGDMIGVVGKIQTRTYTDKEGNRRAAVEVVVDNAYFGGVKKATATTDEQETYGDNSYTEVVDDDDLPF